ncbi:MAG: NUDIX hydrolase [Patescibacteria group bacterium]|nr:NUDIX hydrolase [Patescibacteria group bacterium]
MDSELVKGAGAAILDRQKILLTKRALSKEYFPGYWDFPGGRTDLIDSEMEENAIRETNEEVNLKFEVDRKLGLYKYQRDHKMFHIHVFLGNWEGNIKLQEDEVSEYGWFTHEEAIKLELAFSYREVIDDLRKKRLL